MGNWMIYSLALLALLNFAASVAIIRADSLARAQRSVQIVLVWLVPVVGAVLALAFLAADRPTAQVLSGHDPALGPGDETSLARGPTLCGCSGSGGGDD
jgi:hypothetical protein